MKNNDFGSIALIITGCINPNPNQQLAIKDKDTRLMQYIDSVLFYIDNSVFTKIVFCDNSNCDDERILLLKDYALLKHKEFEYLTFCGNEELVVRYSNKGCGEDEIMNYIMSNSLLIKTVDSFFKVTGRLKLLNINKIVLKTRLTNNYFLRDIYGRLNWLDTRFYMMSKTYYLHNVRNCYMRLKDFSLTYEAVYYILVKEYKDFAFYPSVQGVSGGNNHVYDTDRGWTFAFYNILCRMELYNILFPIIWFVKRCVIKLRKFI